MTTPPRNGVNVPSRTVRTSECIHQSRFTYPRMPEKHRYLTHKLFEKLMNGSMQKTLGPDSLGARPSADPESTIFSPEAL